MALIDWTNDLSVEVAEIDAEHKELVRLINKLNDAMIGGKGKDVMGEIISGLITYTASHFAHEERYFIKFGYKGADKHKAEHKDFVANVTKFKNDFDKGSALLSLSVMRFLKDWLVKHIKGTDKLYVSCFHSNGLK